MSKAKLLILWTAFAISTTVMIGQQMRTMTAYTTGTGSASEPDRSQSLDEATEQAQNWANSSCIGTMTTTNTTSSGCVKIGSVDENNVSYACTVTVKAACEIQYRGK
jgi:hypothetical protein